MDQYLRLDIYLSHNMTHCLTRFFQDTFDKAFPSEGLLLGSLVFKEFWLFPLLFKSSGISFSASVVPALSSFSSPTVSRLPLCLKDGGLLPRGPLTFDFDLTLSHISLK